MRVLAAVERPGQRRRRQGAGGAFGLCHLLHARHLPQRRRRARTFPDVRRHRRRLWRAAVRRRHRRGLFRRAGELSRRVPRGRLSGAPAHLRHPARFRRRRAAIRGGCGIVREYEILAEEAVLAVRIDSVKNPPWGIDGGMAGGTGRAVVNPGTNHERVLAPLSDGNVLKRGDILRIETGGGGGHGHPFDRPAGDGARGRARRLRDRRGRASGSMASCSPTARVDKAATARAARTRARRRRLSTATRMSMSSADTSLVGRRRHRRHLHRHRAARPGDRPGLARQDAERARRSRPGLPDRHRLALADAGARRRGARPRAARHHRRHQHDPGRQGRARRPGHHARAFAMCWRSAARTSRARANSLRLGEAARARCRPRACSRSTSASAPAAWCSSRWTRRACQAAAEACRAHGCRGGRGLPAALLRQPGA